MPSPHQTFTEFAQPAELLRQYEDRLKVISADLGIHLIPGLEADFVCEQWTAMLVRHRSILTADVIQILAQEVLGELCHLLARFDSVIMAGNDHAANVSAQNRQLVDFISKHKSGFVAVDFCTHLYRRVMPFRVEDYDTTLAEMLKVCEFIDADPVQGQSFIKLLKYPDKMKIMN